LDDVRGWREDVQRGREAEELLNSPVFRRVAEAVKLKCVERWRGSEPDAVSVRESAYAVCKAIDTFLDGFHAEISRGEMAAAQLKRRKLDA
jgi:hypothetical protein